MIRDISLIVVLIVGLHPLVFSQESVLKSHEHSKIAPSLRNQEVEFIRVRVTEESTFMQWMKEHFPNSKIEKERLPNVYRVRLTSIKEIEKLAKSPAVEFIDRGDRLPIEEKALGAFDMTLNNVFAAQFFYNVNGKGLVVSIKEKPFDVEDIDLKNRILLSDQFDEPATQHATSMATIIAGAGNSEPSGRGAAPGAEVATSDFLQLLPDDGNTLLNLRVSLQNHSYGVGVENYYGIETSAYDEQCNNIPSLVHVFSSGNEGDKPGTGTYAIQGFANLTGQFKVSKNILTVGSADVSGNVVAKSSRGPAHDGRIKPEIVAYGDAGSSDAAAVVSGISLLVQQKYNDQVGALPPSSLVKAVLINSAHDVGRPGVDFESGFGNADALGAVRTIDEDKFLVGDISENEEEVFSVNVAPNTNTLKVTLVWNDLAALPSATSALINDLDLHVRHVASGTIWKPWVLSHYPHPDSLSLMAKRKVDHLNNVEQVTIDLPVAGDYEIVIRGFDIPQGTQTFSIAYETAGGFDWTNPTHEALFTAGRTNFIRWRWSQSQATGKLEYKSVGQTHWIEINSSVNLSSGYYPWLTPDSTLHVQLRMTVANTSYESEMFTIVRPIALKVGYNCSEEAMLLWSGIQEADQYQLFRLGEKYMEPFLVTTDTFAILNSSDKEVLHYAVSPVINGVTGQKGTTIDYTSVGTDCYFISFLPRQYIVTDQVFFDLTVGTTHKLQSVIFERLTDNLPVEIQKITPASTNILLQDNAPEPGSNYYRVRLENNSMQSLYVSGYEEIFYVRNQDLFVYPNPIISGELLNVVVNDLGNVTLRVYDMMGRMMQEITDPGTIKTIDTTALIKGAYVIEVLKTSGSRLTARLMVF